MWSNKLNTVQCMYDVRFPGAIIVPQYTYRIHTEHFVTKTKNSKKLTLRTKASKFKPFLKEFLITFPIKAISQLPLALKQM